MITSNDNIKNDKMITDNIKEMIKPNDNINDSTLNVIIFEGQNIIIFEFRGYYHF